MKLLRWIALLLFTQCFLYKNTDFGLSLNIGVSITPDRLIFIIISILAILMFKSGELQFPGLGKVEYCILVFAIICTISASIAGNISSVFYWLFDFNYNPFVIFILAKSIPHNRAKLESFFFPFLAIGAYLAINGVFEYRGPQALVWPQYILDPHVGIQFGRTRGSFASSEALGGALVETFLFYALYTTKVKGEKLYWAYMMMLTTCVIIYATSQRSSWVSFGSCLLFLIIAKTNMRQIAIVIIGIILLGFFSGINSKFSFWSQKTLFSKRQETVNYRKVNNLTTLDMGKANPIFGVGFGSFVHEWQQYFHPIDDAGIRDLTDGNHNTFLGLFAEVGVVGLISYLMIFYYMFRVGLRVYRKVEGFEREFVLVFLLALISYIIGGNVSDYRHGQFCNTTLFLLFGTVAGIEAQMAFSTHLGRQKSSSAQSSIRGAMATTEKNDKQWSEWQRIRAAQVPYFKRSLKRLNHV
jgi:hypothetical protein